MWFSAEDKQIVPPSSPLSPWAPTWGAQTPEASQNIYSGVGRNQQNFNLYLFYSKNQIDKQTKKSQQQYHLRKKLGFTNI